MSIKMKKGVYTIAMKENPEMSFKTVSNFTILCISGAVDIYYVANESLIYNLVNGEWVLDADRSFTTKSVSTTYIDCDIQYVLDKTTKSNMIPGREYTTDWTVSFEELV